ncbi:MAG: NUDIX domain-containing protein [Candidatus Aenigmarchaeota archaeon]|nr:NUDIX domain-containing protein [Candidatus Aenigmarchaeota archaeon]
METEKSVGVILFHRKSRKFLLLHYIEGYWGFSKGHAEPGETEKQAALRELEEETCIREVALLEGFREETQYFYRRGGKLINKTVIYFLGDTSQERVKLSREHKAFVWLPYQEALKKLTFDNSRKELEKAWKFLQER